MHSRCQQSITGVFALEHTLLLTISTTFADLLKAATMARSATLLVCLVSCMCVMTAYAGTYEILQDTSKQDITCGLPCSHMGPPCAAQQPTHSLTLTWAHLIRNASRKRCQILHPAQQHQCDSLLLLSIPSSYNCCSCCCLLTAGYKQLKTTSGQWKVSVSATKSADKSTFTPIACNETALTAACNQPALTADNKDKLRVDLQLKDKTLKTYDDLEPKRVLVRACYTKASAVDRPWRRSNDVIDVSIKALCAVTVCSMAWRRYSCVLGTNLVLLKLRARRAWLFIA